MFDWVLNMPLIGERLKMLRVGRLRVHGFSSRRLTHREVLVAGSDYDRSYLWCLRKLAFGDSTGSDGVGKDGFACFQDLFGA